MRDANEDRAGNVPQVSEMIEQGVDLERERYMAKGGRLIEQRQAPQHAVHATFICP